MTNKVLLGGDDKGFSAAGGSGCPLPPFYHARQ